VNVHPFRSAPVLAWLALAANCDDPADDRPPPLIETETPPAAVACSTLTTEDISFAGIVVQIDSAPAECAASGMICPIQGGPEWISAADCDPAVEAVHAECSSDRQWTLACHTAPASVGAGGDNAGGSAGRVGSAGDAPTGGAGAAGAAGAE